METITLVPPVITTITVTVDDRLGPGPFTWTRDYTPNDLGLLWEAAAESTTTDYYMH